MNSPLLKYCGVRRKTTMSIEILPLLGVDIFSFVAPISQKRNVAIDKNCDKSRAAYNRKGPHTTPKLTFFKKALEPNA